MTDWWWIYLALGAFIGFFAGMLGIGGGFTMVPSMLMAPVGASVAHRTSGSRLRKIFALLLYALGTKMVWSFF